MEKYVLASGNKDKMKEISKILDGFGIELLTMSEVGLGDLEIIEDGETFEENSLIKAEAVMEFVNRPTIADDSGLMVDYLGGDPGVYSARYAGEDVTYEDNNDKLLVALDGVEKNKRGAKFVTVITMLFPNGDKIVARGEVEGFITNKRRGNEGFGYDPIFMVEDGNVTFAEMDLEEKNKISHRARALMKFKLELENYFGEK